jgi:RNA polymerase sigma factor (TIGR02999 family)
MTSAGDITRLLGEWARGNGGALDVLMPLVYAELRRIADGYLRRERTGHTLQPTALVHEAWLRFSGQDELLFEHRTQFYALAAQIMRRILVDHARAVNAEKRGGGAERAPLDESTILAPDRIEAFLALDEALQQLSRLNPRQAQVIEMRYFAGLNVVEMAAVLGVSPATISRDQKTAEAWLNHVMMAPPPPAPPPPC